MTLVAYILIIVLDYDVYVGQIKSLSLRRSLKCEATAIYVLL